jgi:hypothetical protein
LVDEKLRLNSKYQIRNLAIGESVLSRQDYLKRPEEFMNFRELTVLMMPWSGLKELPENRDDHVKILKIGQEVSSERGWGVASLQREFLQWLEETRGDCKEPVVKVAQWQCHIEKDPSVLPGRKWKLVDTGLWDYWRRETQQSATLG